MNNRAGALVGALVLFTTVAFAAPPPHRLKITAGADHLAVSKATPGGAVFLVGYEQRVVDYSRAFRRVERKAVAAADGTARLELKRPMAQNSYWVVIDLTSGAFAAVTSDGRKLREAELPPDALKKENGRSKKVVTRLDYVHAMLVRPRVGLWVVTVGDGGPADTDGMVDGKIEIDASRLEQHDVTTAEAGGVAPGDLLFVFLPREMGYFVTEAK